jgi:hypothetical protein
VNIFPCTPNYAVIYISVLGVTQTGCIAALLFAQTASKADLFPPNPNFAALNKPIHLERSHLQLQHLLPSVHLTSKFQCARKQNRAKQSTLNHLRLHTETVRSVGTQTVLLCCARAKPRLPCQGGGRNRALLAGKYRILRLQPPAIRNMHPSGGETRNYCANNGDLLMVKSGGISNKTARGNGLSRN